MSENLEQRLADSLRYAATQVRPVPVERLVHQLRHPRWRRLFERRLGESLRYGATKAKPTGDPLPVRQRPRQPWYRGRLAIVVAGLLAAVVVSAPLALAHRQADRAAGRSALAGAGGSTSWVPQTAPVPGMASWSLTSGLYQDYDGTQLIAGKEVVLNAGEFVFLIAWVRPAAPLGKTYLQRILGESWQTLGPHELDPASRVAYLLRPTITTTYRVYVPGAQGRLAAATASVTVRIRR
jgi:hypothetical protein